MISLRTCAGDLYRNSIVLIPIATISTMLAIALLWLALTNPLAILGFVGVGVLYVWLCRCSIAIVCDGDIHWKDAFQLARNRSGVNRGAFVGLLVGVTAYGCFLDTIWYGRIGGVGPFAGMIVIAWVALIAAFALIPLGPACVAFPDRSLRELAIACVRRIYVRAASMRLLVGLSVIVLISAVLILPLIMIVPAYVALVGTRLVLQEKAHAADANLQFSHPIS